MSLFKTDPLLAFCRLMAWLFLLATAGGLLAALAAAVTTIVNADFMLWALRTSYPQLQELGLQLAFALAMIFVVIGFGLIIRFLGILLAIIRSVARGEAFSLANAARIRAMAWISLIGMPVGFCIAAAFGRVVFLLGPRAPEAGIRIEVPSDGYGYGQILMTLLLFVLARLFAQGAAMRDEIEGTV